MGGPVLYLDEVEVDEAIRHWVADVFSRRPHRPGEDASRRMVRPHPHEKAPGKTVTVWVDYRLVAAAVVVLNEANWPTMTTWECDDGNPGCGSD